MACANLAACVTVGPDFVPPVLDAPPEWSAPLSEGLDAPGAPPDQWWMLFADPVLDELVTTARKRNNNLEIAALRVLEARAQLGIATGSQYPQSQFAAASATHVSPADNALVSSSFEQYSAGASVAWELDFWGRFRRGIESAEALWLASIADYHQFQVLLTAAVVDAYTAVRVTQEQLRIAHDNVVLQQRSFEIAEVLYRQGSDSELDMQQARTLLLATEASIPEFEAALVQARNALSVLLGLPPGGVEPMLTGADAIPTVPADLAIGVPADMLRRRPDVREAELLAMAQNALVGLAEADLYPSFSLAGSIGVSAGGPGDGSFGDLFDSDALEFSVGANLVWPFLNYGRIRNNVRVQDARLQQALVFYRENVLQAAREAEDAIAGFIGARRQARILAETVQSAERSNAISTLQYREGFSDYQRVLDSQQALFTQQQRYVAAQGNVVFALVDLYQALGGGWDASGVEPMPSPDSIDTMRERTNWGDMLEPTAPASAPESEPDD